MAELIGTLRAARSSIEAAIECLESGAPADGRMERELAAVSGRVAELDRALAGRAPVPLQDRDDLANPPPPNETERQLDLALRAAGMGTWTWDPVGDVLVWVAPDRDRTGAAPGGLPATLAEFLKLVHVDDRAAVEAGIDGGRSRGELDVADFRIRVAGGGTRWFALRGASFRDPATGAVRLTGIVWDITDRKQSEERMRTLMSELDHRVKNVLAMISAIVSRIARTDSDEAWADRLQGRIHALANAHALLGATRWTGARLHALIETELEPWDRDRHHVSIEGPDVTLATSAAQLLAMAVHELTTNAVKYGALSADNGRVDVTWRVTGTSGDRRLELDWAESGGPTVREPVSGGFGTTVITMAVPHELGGTVDLAFRPAGVRCLIRIDGRHFTVEPVPLTPTGNAGDLPEQDRPASKRSKA